MYLRRVSLLEAKWCKADCKRDYTSSVAWGFAWVEMKELWHKLQQLLPQLKMRLRASVRRRLAIDIMALGTGVRAAVMLDYIPCTPAMLQQLCQLLLHVSQEVDEVAALRVLHMEGCGYLVHPSYLLEYMDRSLSSPSPLLFIVLDDEIPRKASQTEQETIVKSLSETQQRISSLLLVQSVNTCSLTGTQESKETSLLEVREGAVPNVIAVGDPTSGSGILLPTLNGWLLGYPVVYFFLEENASRAGRCVGSGPVQLHQVLIGSSLLNASNFQKEAESICDEDELLSFTVPNDLSPLGLSEDWAQLFFKKVTASVQRASDVWKSVRVEVTTRKMEFIVL